MSCTPQQATEELNAAASTALRFGGNFAKTLLPYMVQHWLDTLRENSVQG